MKLPSRFVWIGERKTIYEAPQAARLHAAPIVAPGVAGMDVPVRF